MRNFYKAEGVVFLSVCFLSVFIRSDNVVQMCKMYI